MVTNNWCINYVDRNNGADLLARIHRFIFSVLIAYGVPVPSTSSNDISLVAMLKIAR